MPRKANVSPAMEDYLEAVLSLGDEGRPVRVTDIAARLGVAKASVTQALAGLKVSGYIKQEPYGRVFLSDAGLAHARMVEKRHRVLRAFLTEALGVAAATADAEACRLEHSISQDTLAKLVDFMERYRDGQ